MPRRRIRLDLSVEMLFLRLMALCCAAIGALIGAAGVVLLGMQLIGDVALVHAGALTTVLLVVAVGFLAVTWVCGRRLAIARLAYEGRRSRHSS